MRKERLDMDVDKKVVAELLFERAFYVGGDGVPLSHGNVGIYLYVHVNDAGMAAPACFEFMECDNSRH